MLATMNTAAPFWVSIALLVPRALAAPADSSAAAAAPSCTASLITSLCDYPSAGPEFSVAISSRASCWEYCNDHPPCNFAIFFAGYLVHRQWRLLAGWRLRRDASPSAVASVCGYPTPPDNCQSSCYASSGSAHCLSICAKADSCNYAIFKAMSESKSPYSAGSCWIYTEGKFNPGLATACTGSPDQFVYNNLDNVCPKPSPTSSSLASSATAHSSGTGTASATTGSHGSGGSGGTTGDTTGSADGAATSSTGTETTGDTTGSSNGSGTSSNGSGTTGNTGSSTSSSGTNSNGTGTKSNGTETAAAPATTTTNSAAAGLSLTNPLAIGAAVLIWMAL
ncbi:hypothetical protein VE04_01748 [Pseudogymnoascus sp. 24MN13]|nr:hypothetical protein VE04_01748 [Pseudogymnoascus sp. 24MN13]